MHPRKESVLRTAFVYTDRYFEYDYGWSHPLKIERLKLTFDLCKAYKLFDLDQTSLVESAPATEAEILRFHTPAYVEVLKEANGGSLRRLYTHGLGPGDNPIFPGLWNWSLLHTGSSLQCARLVSEKKTRIAFNISGGLHHALADRASGFCYVNDPVLVICHFLDQGRRVMYVDIDAHHGDGVQWAFYQDPRVLTVSFHQDGNTLFPGTGRVTEMGKGEGVGYSVNVPMHPGTDDGVFLEGFHAVVPRLLESFRPDVVVTQLGVDAFWNDPLADLELTTNGFCEVVSFMVQNAPAWVALGGGGYSVANVARAWSLAWAIMNDVHLPDDLPESMAGPLSAEEGVGPKLRDNERVSRRHNECKVHMKETIGFLEKEVFPLVKSGQ
jgi:acetoin utilization protein AcuC